MNWKKILIALVAAVLVAVGVGAIKNAAGATDKDDCEPTDGWTEVTDWVLESPGEGWYQVDERKVVDQEATEDEVVFDHWQRYSWTGGPHESDDPPPFPHEDWQPNVQGDPHGVGTEGAYWRSHGGSGNGDWFYLEAVTKVVPGQEEVSHIEYKFAFDHPAVDCPPEDPEDPVCPDDSETSDRPIVPDECDEDPQNPPVIHEVPEDSHGVGTPVSQTRDPQKKVAVPTVVNSGL